MGDITSYGDDLRGSLSYTFGDKPAQQAYPRYARPGDGLDLIFGDPETPDAPPLKVSFTMPEFRMFENETELIDYLAVRPEILHGDVLPFMMLAKLDQQARKENGTS